MPHDRGNQRTFTAPLGIIQVNGVTVGKMRNVRLTETLRRVRVTGIGQLTPTDLPAVEWSGTLSCSSYTINFNLLLNREQKGTFRNMTTVEEWSNAVLMQETGLEIAIMRKVKDGEPDLITGAANTRLQQFAKVGAAFVTREGFDLNEGQLSGRDTEFEYLEPVLYNEVLAP
jgi:hypothetical protein